MTLNVAKLRSDIKAHLDAGGSKASPSSLEAAAKWATIYDTYARQATDVSGDKVAVTNKLGFQAALAFTPAGLPITAALQFQAGFMAYWTGAVFAVGIPPTPAAACPSIPPAPPWAVEVSSLVASVLPGLAPLLVPTFANTANRPTSVVAGELASAFHTATTTMVMVLITGITLPPPPGGLPVVNTCTVF
jgi:hypothetical protein